VKLGDSMLQQVSDTASNRRDQIANFAELLRNAPAKQKVFEAVYRGKKRFKTARELAVAAGFPTTKYLPEKAKSLVHEKLFDQDRERVDGSNQTVYKKIDFVATNKSKILQLARSKVKLAGYHTKTNPKAHGAKFGRIILKIPFRIKIHALAVDEVDQFSKVKAVKVVPERLTPERLSEKAFKVGLLRLLRETTIPKDWGGESNDIFTTKLKIRGRSKRAAFALKGPAKKGPLVPGMMGKNGDQIQRLYSSPAEVFFVQYEGEIKESIVALMEELAKAKAALGQEIFFGVINREDSYRLRLAYPNAFATKP
jgi:hypothetical protein